MLQVSNFSVFVRRAFTRESHCKHLKLKQYAPYSIATDFRQLVRLGTSWPVLFTCLCSCTTQLAFFVLRPIWMNIKTCGCFIAPQGKLTLTTWVLHTSHHTLSSSYNLVRAPLHLCRYRRPHGSHGAATPSSVSCLQVTHNATCPQIQTDLTRTVTSDFMSATLAETTTQLSFAEFSERCISFSTVPTTNPHTISGCRRLFHTSLSHRKSPPTPARGVLSQTRPPARCIGGLASTHDVLCPRVPDPSLRHPLMRLCKRLHAVLHPPIPPLNYRIVYHNQSPTR